MVPSNEDTNSGYHISVTMFGSSHMINSDQSLANSGLGLAVMYLSMLRSWVPGLAGLAIE